MMSAPSLYVVDTNILIDLHIGGLLQELKAAECVAPSPRCKRFVINQ
jgi:hypothetical protein